MALPSYYSTGTASVTQGETVVTGASTAWTSPLRAGDLFGIHIGLAVPIASVDSDTQLTLAFPWPGATQSAAAYAVQIIPDVARMQETTRIVLQQIGEGNLQALAGLPGEADKLPFFTGAGTMAVGGPADIGAATAAQGAKADSALQPGDADDPSGSVGITVENGTSTKFMRSDAAPALDQAIAPTWTGKHTFTLDAGGLASTGTPNQDGSFLGVAQKFGHVLEATALQAGPNQAETTMVVNMTTAAGAADPVGSFKTAFGATVTANNGAADVWAQSNVVTLGDSNARGGVVLELDLNNFSGVSQSETPATPYVGNLILTGQNTNGTSTAAISDFAIGIMNTVNAGTHMWRNGIYGGPSGYAPFADSFIFDESDVIHGIKMAGTKTTAIDLSRCLTSNAMFVGNNSYVIGSNSAASAVYTLLGVDTGNHIVLGDGNSAYISARQSINPSADNTYTLGVSGSRWNAVWAANGTIQTSDPRLKKDIENLPECLPIVMSLTPKTFKWIEGGTKIEMIKTADGRVVQETVPVPGKRTHWGFMAPDVKKAFEVTGKDFGGYVKSEDGTEHLRPDQLIPVLWKTVQELATEIAALKAAMPASSASK